MKLQDRIAIVTGAASGIAQAVAIRFAAEGAAVMAADTDEKNGLETVERIRAAGGRAEFIRLDVSSSDQVKQAVQQTIDTLGGLHILFNGAGILAYGTAVETSEQTWNRVMAVNLTGTFLCSKACLPHMIAQGWGSVINVASTTGAHDACAQAVAYVSSKGGVTLLTRAMAIDHAKQGVRVNAICPGPTDTPMLRKALTPEQLEAFAKTFPMGRLGRPEELTGAAVFLASDDASFVTGAMLYVDGGQTAEV
ncbi:MAG TPA: SDR family NAD(P)-dependent oxidoreductase [Terracidiphilus sp.]|jgi:NAD(P)-dependent dehydrogenase (short-subunit alcohol dehydrogenase family)|nr:SDR family NAD(P)-dependent oxidoreductase [Terracidiphilus sp.]